MNRLFIALFAVVFLTNVANAESSWVHYEQSKRTTAFSVELAGRGALISANFDFNISDYLGLGIGITPPMPTSAMYSASSLLLIPIYTNVYLSDSSSKPYLSAGITPSFIMSYSSTTPDLLITAGAGYEYRGQEGFLFRATLYAMTDTRLSAILINPGVSFGFAL